MRSRQAILFFSPAGRSVPDFVTAWVNGKGIPVITIAQATSVEERVLRSLPTLVVVDAESAGDEGMELCTRLKGDPYLAIVPLAVVINRHATDAVRRWFAAGASSDPEPRMSARATPSPQSRNDARNARWIPFGVSTPTNRAPCLTPTIGRSSRSITVSASSFLTTRFSCDQYSLLPGST